MSVKPISPRDMRPSWAHQPVTLPRRPRRPSWHVTPPAEPGRTTTRTTAPRPRAATPEAAYDPTKPWTMTLGQMQRLAHSQAGRNVLAQIAGLPTVAALQAQQRRQAEGIRNVANAATAGINANNAAYQRFASGISGAFGQGVQQGIAGGNTALAALGQAATGTQGGGLLSAMGANMAGALQGAANAAQASGAAYARASQNDLADQIRNRNAQAAAIRAKAPGLEDQYLAALKQEAMQRATMIQNAQIAAAQFGLKQQQQADLNAYRQGVLKNQADANGIRAAANDLKLQQLKAQVDYWNRTIQAKYDLAKNPNGGGIGGPGTPTRREFVNDITKMVNDLRGKTTAGGKSFIFKFRIKTGGGDPIYDADGNVKGYTNPTYRTITQTFDGTSMQDAQRRADTYLRNLQTDNRGQSIDYEFQSAVDRPSRRSYRDNDIIHQVVGTIMQYGIDRTTATNMVRRIMGLAPVKPRRTYAPGQPARSSSTP